ncbi:hypothetical protein GDO81_011413 [Engystomops pustulosus]|uniref:Uncharacterized protein n=1 Tax=Engystomops pustulosus TaxID=76066 RepID=A0AAV7BDW2_ENGPU|nr:hypothetical protein GDO81_011413 [Engystomops pustulosus]
MEVSLLDWQKFIFSSNNGLGLSILPPIQSSTDRSQVGDWLLVETTLLSNVSDELLHGSKPQDVIGNLGCKKAFYLLEIFITSQVQDRPSMVSTWATTNNGTLDFERSSLGS